MFTVEISVGVDGKGRWCPVPVDAYHETFDAALDRVDRGGGRYGWVRIVDAERNIVPLPKREE
jgi:hypothetical protein